MPYMLNSCEANSFVGYLAEEGTSMHNLCVWYAASSVLGPILLADDAVGTVY